jgi:hypothetical protein
MVREASSLCGCRVVDLITSGYNPRILPLGWVSLICGLTGIELDIEEPSYPSWLEKASKLAETQEVVEQIKQNLKPLWRSFS